MRIVSESVQTLPSKITKPRWLPRWIIKAAALFRMHRLEKEIREAAKPRLDGNAWWTLPGVNIVCLKARPGESDTVDMPSAVRVDDTLIIQTMTGLSHYGCYFPDGDHGVSLQMLAANRVKVRWGKDATGYYVVKAYGCFWSAHIK